MVDGVHDTVQEGKALREWMHDLRAQNVSLRCRAAQALAHMGREAVDELEEMDFLLWEAFYVLQFFALEFFFRGFLLQGLKRYVGAYAVFFMAVPYCMIHFGKPMPETLGAIIAGVALGTLALRTGSIWSGVLIHASVAVSMDVLSMWQNGRFG